MDLMEAGNIVLNHYYTHEIVISHCNFYTPNSDINRYSSLREGLLSPMIIFLRRLRIPHPIHQLLQPIF